MDRRIYIGLFCSLVATVAILATAIPVSTQTTGSFQYVIPHFNSNSGSELILSNLSSVLASEKVTFRSSEQAQVADAGINVPAGAQLRLTAGTLAVSSYDGTVIVVSSSRLSVIATLSTGSGFESVVPATSGTDLIIPFSQGTTGRMKVTIYNPDDRSTSVVILPIAPDGTVVGNAAPTVAALGTLKLDIATLFPQPSTGPLRDISHLLIRVPKSVLGPDHRVFVQAEMINFSDAAQGNCGASQRFFGGHSSTSWYCCFEWYHSVFCTRQRLSDGASIRQYSAPCGRRQFGSGQLCRDAF